jgi:hypothetical protein
VEKEVSEMDQRRKLEIDKRNSVARTLHNMSNLCIEQQMAILDNEVTMHL